MKRFIQLTPIPFLWTFPLYIHNKKWQGQRHIVISNKTDFHQDKVF